MVYYAYPAPEAYNMNKLMYDLKEEPELRKRFLADPDGLMQERNIPADQAALLKELDEEKLAAAGAHRLLVFLVKYNLAMDKERERFTMQETGS